MRFALLVLVVGCASAEPSAVTRPDAAAPSPASVTTCTEECATAACTYEGYVCGTFFDVGGAKIDCGRCAGISRCDASHQCVIERDAREDNDVRSRATWLGELNDVDNAFVALDELSIDSLADEDWFALHVTDGFDAGNPRIRVVLDRLAARHELAVWFRCDGENLATRARCGDAAQNTLADPLLGVGCMIEATEPWAAIVPSCTGIADSGTLTFRIRSHVPPRGELYRVRVSVE